MTLIHSQLRVSCFKQVEDKMFISDKRGININSYAKIPNPQTPRPPQRHPHVGCVIFFDIYIYVCVRVCAHAVAVFTLSLSFSRTPSFSFGEESDAGVLHFCLCKCLSEVQLGKSEQPRLSSNRKLFNTHGS